MVRIIAHRGFWWPDIDHQNRPWALQAAIDRGWDVEVDVWGVREDQLQVGHDKVEARWTLPSIAESHVFVHMKAPTQALRISAVLERTGYQGKSSVFVSPMGKNNELVLSEAVVQLLVVSSHNDLFDKMDVLQSAKRRGWEQTIRGVWLEQPDTDWVTDGVIHELHAYGMRAYVVSPELHRRQLRLDMLSEWADADGVCTDYPHLLSQILNPKDVIVHPVGAWW
jgi:glycerophosphoryl diester phosphodiesterase